MKGNQWVKDRYFKTEGTRNWVFAADIKTREGEPWTVKLMKAGDTKIQRHIKIRGEANPFDPKQETYFEGRLGLKMKGSLIGQIKWLRLWWSQDKECPVCNEKITEETRWNLIRKILQPDGARALGVAQWMRQPRASATGSQPSRSGG